MHTIETLEAKKATLVAQRDQLMANFNASLGAIAMVDELLGELHRAAETQRHLDQVAKAMAEEARAKSAAAQNVITYQEIGEAEPRSVPGKPEMLPVVHEVESIDALDTLENVTDRPAMACCSRCFSPNFCAHDGCQDAAVGASA